MTWNVIKRVKGQFSFLLNTTGVIRYWKQTSSSLVHEDVIWWRLDEQEANFLCNFPSSLTNKLHLLQWLLFSRKDLLHGQWIDEVTSRTRYQRTNTRHHAVTSQRQNPNYFLPKEEMFKLNQLFTFKLWTWIIVMDPPACLFFLSFLCFLLSACWHTCNPS